MASETPTPETSDGDYLLELEGVSEPDAAVEDSPEPGWLDYNRPPRLHAPDRQTTFRLPNPPSEQARTGLPWLVMLLPLVLAAADNRFLRAKGIPAYGFIPCLLSPEEQAGFHGNDEFLTIENLNMGCELMYEIVRRVCT